MTSVVLVDTGERVVECIAADEGPQLVSRTETQARGASQLLRALFSPFQPLKSFPGCFAHVLRPSLAGGRVSSGPGARWRCCRRVCS